MTPLAFELQLAALALAASLALGVPVRLLGVQGVVDLAVSAARFARHRRLALAGLGMAGAFGGLWSMQAVRDLVTLFAFG